MRFLVRTAFCLAIVLPAAGCVFDPNEYEHRIGIIEFAGQGPTITVPATVVQGQPFQVTVVTYGGGCHEKGPTETGTHGGNIANVTPYDRVDTSEEICTNQLKSFLHTAEFRFQTPGEVTVNIDGMRDVNSHLEGVTVTRTVTVQPASGG